MWLIINGVSPEVEKEVNQIAEELWAAFGCISSVNEEATMTGIGIAIDVTMPEDQEIFLPATTKVSVFKIDTKRQLMTLMYFPDVKDRAEVLAN